MYVALSIDESISQAHDGVVKAEVEGGPSMQRTGRLCEWDLAVEMSDNFRSMIALTGEGPCRPREIVYDGSITTNLNFDPCH